MTNRIGRGALALALFPLLGMLACADVGPTTLGAAATPPPPEDSQPPSAPTPIDPTPIDPTPIDPTPIDPTPIDPTPIDPTPIDPTPIDPTPIDPPASGGTEVAGAVDGTFTLAGSPYLVVGDLWVPIGRTLVIEPGVQLRFQGHFKMNVYGSLDARGTADSRILFTAEDPADGWYGLRWEDPATHDTTVDNWIEFVTFEYGDKSHPTNYGWYENGRGGALFVYNQSGMHIHDNVFRFSKAQDKCGAAVFISVGPGIDMSRNVFEDNWSMNAGGAVCFLHGASGTSHYVSDGVFRRNQSDTGTGGVYVYDTRVVLQSDLFEENTPSDYAGSTITVLP